VVHLQGLEPWAQ